MTIALIVTASLLGLIATASGIQKLRKDPKVLEVMHSVGVKDSQLPILAGLEITGALGLLIGIWIPPLGIAASIGLALYFLGAVVAHVRAKDSVKGLAAPSSSRSWGWPLSGLSLPANAELHRR
jgi:uncharacterized membrane protein YphA (DoxX/SURF4 family)